MSVTCGRHFLILPVEIKNIKTMVTEHLTIPAVCPDTDMKFRLTTTKDDFNLTLDEGLHFAIGLAYSDGSFEASTIQSQLMVSYGTTVILQSVNIGGSWYWLKVPS